MGKYLEKIAISAGLIAKVINRHAEKGLQEAEKLVAEGKNPASVFLGGSAKELRTMHTLQQRPDLLKKVLKKVKPIKDMDKRNINIISSLSKKDPTIATQYATDLEQGLRDLSTADSNKIKKMVRSFNQTGTIYSKSKLDPTAIAAGTSAALGVGGLGLGAYYINKDGN